MKKVDYIIVGQGIAGTMLSWFLLRRGKKVLVVDNYKATSSSQVAAGIYNPITGRRFVKSWLADDLFPFAKETYQNLEKELNTRFYHPLPIKRYINGELEKKEFTKKSERPEYQAYLSQGTMAKNEVTINHGGYVDFIALLKNYRDFLRENKLIIESHFTFHDITLGRNDITWRDYAAEKTIFCEGYHVLNNPFFSHLPFTSSKGEIITIKTIDLAESHLINKGIFLLPVGNQQFRVGSTYDWEDRTETPTDKAKKELVEKLGDLIGNEFEIIDHQAGIRPTVKDRRPIIGLHPEFEFIGVFNGFGTKGASLAPYFAEQFTSHLIDGRRLHPEVRISRF